ncbi:MAG TPA: PA2169 family four-helix-bundle protein [Polyangiaceae bacterium]|jgi:uncharacterized protein (TIGR02284 family)
MDRTDAATRLEQDHGKIVRSLARLLDFANADDEALLREEWDALEAHLLGHMDAEEMFLLPSFDRVRPADSATIRREHADIRRTLGELGVAADLHTLRAETVSAFRQQLDEHMALERDTLYPWAQEKADSDLLRLVLRELHPAEEHGAKAAQALGALLEACKDGERGYRAAASDVPERGYQLMFAHYADERAAFAAKLEEALGALGGHPTRDGSRLGALHRGWIDTKAVVTGGSPSAVLSECQRGEEAALRVYRTALRAELPPSLREIVQEQYAAVKKAHAEVSALARK